MLSSLSTSLIAQVTNLQEVNMFLLAVKLDIKQSRHRLHHCFCVNCDCLDFCLSSLWTHISAGAFVICWTPGLMTLLLDGLLGQASHANTYEKFCLLMAQCNSLVNPIIYSLRDAEMRSTFKSILCCRCEQKTEQSRVITSPLSERRSSNKVVDHMNASYIHFKLPGLTQALFYFYQCLGARLTTKTNKTASILTIPPQ